MSPRAISAGRPALGIVAERLLPHTPRLALASLTFVLVAGMPPGAFAALRCGSWLDRLPSAIGRHGADAGLPVPAHTAQ